MPCTAGSGFRPRRRADCNREPIRLLLSRRWSLTKTSQPGSPDPTILLEGISDEHVRERQMAILLAYQY
jgi:hypothetical protein